MDTYADRRRKKDIDFSFVGQVYRNRVKRDAAALVARQA